MHEQTTISLTSLSLRGNYLKTSDVLKVSEGLISGNGKFAATIGVDGRLCIYLKRKTGNEADLYHCVMMTGWPEGDYYGVLNSNGCFCINTGTSVEQSNQTVWTTNTVHGFESEYFMIMRDDGNLCIFGGKDPNNYRDMQWCTGTANPVLAQTPPPKPQPEPVMLASTMDYPSRTSWNFPAVSTFAQQFRVQASGTPKALCIGMGNNQNPYSARLKFVRENEVLFEREYGNLKQRSSDWTTVYDLDGFTTPLGQGEMITYELTLFNNAGFEPVFADLPDYPKANSPNGHVAMKFMLNGLSIVHEVEIGVSSREPSGQHLLRTGAVGHFQTGQFLHGVIESTFEVLQQSWDFHTNVITEWVQTPARGRTVRGNPLWATTVPPSWFYMAPGRFNPTVTAWGIDETGLIERTAHHDGDEVVGIVNPTFVAVSRPIFVKDRQRVWYGDPRSAPDTPNVPTVSGMHITFMASAPANMPSSGRLGVMQFVRGSRRFTKNDNSVFTMSTNQDWYLDREEDCVDVLYSNRSRADIDPGEIVTVEMGDSPSFELTAAFKTVLVSETFRTYLVYWPYAPGSTIADRRYFPIGYVEWGWTVYISRNMSTGLWSEAPGIAELRPAAYTFTHSNVMPDWDYQSQDYIDQYNGAFPDHAVTLPFSTGPSRESIKEVQVEIHLNQPATSQLRAQVAELLNVKVSNHPRQNNVLLTWITLTAAQKALQVSAVTSVDEVSIAQRYSLGQETRKRNVAVEVAPFSMFYDSPENYKYAEAVSPRSLAMVADQLVALHRRRHPQLPVNAQIITPTTLYLTFNTDINEDILREIASYPQVSLAYVSEFRSDDPPPPIHDGPLF